MTRVARLSVAALLAVAAVIAVRAALPPYLLLVGDTVRTAAVHDLDAETLAAVRRRAVVKIVVGYEPALTFVQELNSARRDLALTNCWRSRS